MASTMDEHSHTLGRFSIYRQFGDALNAIRDIKSDHAYVHLYAISILARKTASPSLNSPLRIFQSEQDSLQ